MKEGGVIVDVSSNSAYILPEFLDATDALAIAMCHYLTGKNALAGRGNGTSWENFVKNNPDRIEPSK